MTTNLINLHDDETKAQTEHHHLLRPPTQKSPTIFKPFPQSIIQSIENDRKHRLPPSHFTSDYLPVKQSSIDTTDDDLDDNDETATTTTRTTTSSVYRKRRDSLIALRAQRSPSDIRVNLYPDVPEHKSDGEKVLRNSIFENEIHDSNPSLGETKSLKQNRPSYLRRSLLEHRFGRRIHSSFSSSLILRSSNRQRSTQNLSQRHNRRQTYVLPRTSKWLIVRSRLHDIAMMSEPYARMKLVERDLRWVNLREQICKQVLEMREMSILRQQDDGLLKKSQKTNFDLKAIPIDEIVYVEQDGRIYSIGTRDLVLGRLIGDGAIELDTFAQLDARRKFQVKQTLTKRQEGRARLKKHIAFSFCLFNLSFIAVMFVAMFIFAVNTVIIFRSDLNS